MNTFLLSLLLFQGFNFKPSLNLTSVIDISWDKGFISHYYLKDEVIVDFNVVFFANFPNYLAQLAIENGRKTEFKEIRAVESRVAGELFPTIELPVKFPSPVAGIIGQGGKLDVSGSQRIEFGGSRTQNLVRKQTEISHESWFPTLDMKQHLGVNLKGTIGEKIHVFIDHDSEREFELKNTIRLKYEGNEDEIIQSINAGNTELSLPGITLIGGPTPHKGLFGIKTESRIGPVNITAIASREEAENQSKKWKGGGVSIRDMKIQDIDFVKSRFFFLLPPDYIRTLSDPHNIFSGNPNLLPKQILSFQVYIDEGDISTTDPGIKGSAFDIPNKYYMDSTNAIDGQFVIKVESDNFFILDTIGISDTFRLPILELNYSLSDEDMLAIRWIFKNWQGKIDTVGIVDTLQEFKLQGLQIIKRERYEGAFDTSYVSWWYELKNIYSIGATGIDESSFNLKVFRCNYGGGEALDVDPATGKTYRQILGLEKDGRLCAGVFDAPRGLIIFPSPYPFIDSLRSDPDSIYDKPKFITGFQNKYYIWIQYKGIAKEYSLDMINIVPGSEVVAINGARMEKDKDYEIDYDIGWIKFITPLADDPNADISVDFQYVPFFQPAAKNLIGLRGESKIGELGQVLSTFIYHSTSSLDFRPRLGTEPRRIVLGEIVGNITTKPEFLTCWVDKFPLIETEAPSSFSLQGNAGFSLPNPNTRNEVYLDDMEGVKSATSLGISRTSWSYGSIPHSKSDRSFAQVQWYNPRDGIEAKELYPDLPEHKRDEKRNILTLCLPSQDSWRYPTQFSFYWVSLQTCVSRMGMDLSESEYFEVWVKGDKGVLHIDVGTNIPEDAIRRDANGDIKGKGLEDTEDKNKNNRLDEGEDTGLDGIVGKDGTATMDDDGNDDYHYDTGNPNDYSRVNGTENDGILNTEDLNLDGIWDKRSNYFSFKIDLANDFPVIQRPNGWKLFRIPLNEANKEGGPQWECIKYARIWVDSLSKGDVIDIAALDIIGNRWKHEGSDRVKISVKNTDEDTGYIYPPIELQKDAYGRTEREQSLVLKYDSLATEGGCYTPYTRPRDFIQYKTLKIWTRGTGEAKLFIRLGGDPLNYYEYKTQIPSEWTDIAINLEEIAQLKLKRPAEDTTTIVYENYKVYGNPSLTNIMRIELGVLNEDSTNPISGEIWFDELRLADVRCEGGVAGNISLSCGIADFASITLSYRASNPYFKNLGSFMSQTEKLGTESCRAFGLGTNFSLNKLLPSDWGMSIPLSFGLTSSSSFPKYQRGSDVVLTREESRRQSSYGVLRNYNINFSKTGSKNPILKLTIDNISAGFSYRDNFSNTYSKIDSSKSYSTFLSYRYSPSLPSIKIRGFELRYYPQSLSANGSYSYARAIEYTRVDTTYILSNPTPPTRGLNAEGSFSYRPINPLNLRYSTSVTNDLEIKKRPDKETGRSERVGVNFSPSIFGFISPNVDYTVSYQEDHRIELDPLRNTGVSSNISFRVPINLTKIVGLVTELRDKTLDSKASIGSPHWVLIQIENLTRKITSPSISHSISRSTQFYSLPERPGFKYRWGIEDQPDTLIPDSRNSAQITRNYSLSGLGLSFKNTSLSGSFTKSISEGGRSGGETKTSHTGFPALSVTVSGLEKFLFFSKLFNSFAVSSDYTMNWDESGPKLKPSDRVTKDINFGSSFQSQWKKGISTRFSSSFTFRDDKTIRDTGPLLFKNKKIAHTLTTSYSFRAPTGIKFPLLKHLKWTSNLDASLSASYSTECEENITNNMKIRDSNSLSVTPQLSYNFSSSITGGASASYNQQWNRIGRGNTRTIGLRFFVEFSF